MINTLAGFLLCAVCTDQEMTKVVLPVEVQQLMSIPPTDPLIEGKVWNRWTSKNFVICALSDAQAKYMNENLESIKSWIYSRWGLVDLDFGVECRILCIDDPALFRKAFRHDTTWTEAKRDANGRVVMYVIYMLANDNPSRILPAPLTEVCLMEFERRYNCRMPAWAYRGMTQLNCSLDQIKTQLVKLASEVQQNQPLYYSESLMKTTREQWMTLPKDRQDLYDRCATAFCLMLRKEYGQNNFLVFLRSTLNDGNPQVALQQVLGFQNHAQFDRTFNRFIGDVARDVMTGKMPSAYLQIRERVD